MLLQYMAVFELTGIGAAVYVATIPSHIGFCYQIVYHTQQLILWLLYVGPSMGGCYVIAMDVM